MAVTMPIINAPDMRWLERHTWYYCRKCWRAWLAQCPHTCPSNCRFSDYPPHQLPGRFHALVVAALRLGGVEATTPVVKCAFIETWADRIGVLVDVHDQPITRMSTVQVMETALADAEVFEYEGRIWVLRN